MVEVSLFRHFISCVFIEWNKLWSGVQQLKERMGKIANKNYTISITYWHMYSSAINRLILKPNRHSFCLQKRRVCQFDKNCLRNFQVKVRIWSIQHRKPILKESQCTFLIFHQIFWDSQIYPNAYANFQVDHALCMLSHGGGGGKLFLLLAEICLENFYVEWIKFWLSSKSSWDNIYQTKIAFA